MGRAYALLIGVIVISGCMSRSFNDHDSVAKEVYGSVEIRRTEDGVPHIKADNWVALGYGYGYAQAEDNLCTMAEAFVTYRGERSQYFGPEGRLRTHSTIGELKNIDADFFFKLVDSGEVVNMYRDHQSVEIRQLVAGFAKGFNAYLNGLRSRNNTNAHQACRTAPWLSDISDADIYRRLYAANMAGGTTSFISGIANAQPPSDPALRRDSKLPAPLADLTRRVAGVWLQAGGQSGIGSNGIAFGASATGTDSGLLLGNPHWYWAGPDRFYQAQLTIPGQINVSGVSFLGVPVIMLGFNNAVAWTHTVSAARRFGIFELTLQAGDPTTYLYDGKPMAMTAVPLTVQVLRGDGSLAQVNRTLYRTRFGPVVDLASFSPALKWTEHKAFALRDVNAENFRIFQNFLEWDQARSLDDFIAIQKRLVAMPWVNTLAVGRNDGRAWYADVGAVPNVPDDLAAACATQLGKAFDKGAPGVPFLDGSRSMCNWRTDADAVQAGALPASAMPSLLRRDYVANMNNSYRLANPAAPLGGFAQIFGETGKPLSLRQRLGYLMVRERLAGTDGLGDPGADSASVRAMSLGSQAMSALLLKNRLLTEVCRRPSISVYKDIATGLTFNPAKQVAIGKACEVLRHWNGAATVDAKGAYLWDEIWKRIGKIAGPSLYAVPFNPADPVNTPSGLDARNPDIAQGFGAAILSIEASGRPIDPARGEVLYVDKDGRNIPLFGGCDGPGYFTSACAAWGDEASGDIRDRDLLGNSYMQVVSFDKDGVQAYVMLSHSQSDDPASLRYSNATRRYATRHWTRWRYTEHDIASDSDLSVLRLTVHGLDRQQAGRRP
ncbi:penicillin acylase family protein [Pollutimonas bauzanensis]|uniref:Acyl-homoserine-lactone acylase n=1 Tax=Pollutimonas bauzanensis TaxID=658167 RepID=A0A1M5W2F8_9BURK|nr:penicillin acylase family protein [Pollutimonas bauzanensis]SHH81627.1 acyl-homoserine-lactone acylase [Pollutimonas bauzanensis]